MRLFHGTTEVAAQTIQAEGFQNGPDGGVWFSQDVDAWDVHSRHLLEITIDMEADELDRYGQTRSPDAERSDTLPDSVKTADAERFRWFKISAEIVNARATVRLVPPQEAWGLQFE